MPDWTMYVVLGVLGIGILACAIGTALLAIALVRFLQRVFAGVAGWRHATRERERLVQQLAADDGAYLACHSLVCGHMHTMHFPDEDGLLRCEACDTPVSA